MPGKNLLTQYDSSHKSFSKYAGMFNGPSIDAFYKMLDFEFNKKTLLDIGCGNGVDLEMYSRRGAICTGIDSSVNMIADAKKRTDASLEVCIMEDLPFANNFFDIVLSKYAFQTSENLEKSLSEAVRVLKIGGTMVYLSVHPMRHFLERKKHPTDYFKPELVKSAFFGGAMTAIEPTHTFNEYFSRKFLERCWIKEYTENPDFPSSEKINGDNYPCFFIVKAQKMK